MGRSRIIELHSFEETFALGKSIAPLLKPNAILALSGDLGAGKTTFVQGLAIGLSISDPITSPTFTYLHLYEGTLPLFHFDLYRLKQPTDFFALGLDEYFEKEGICAIEWPEKLSPFLPPSALLLSFSFHEKGRTVTLSQHLWD